MSRWFKLEEFLISKTAKKKSIDNFPSWEVVEHLSELAWFLDDIRDVWGSGIIITSGFRCEALNKAVKGVKTSIHKIGYAADIYPSNGKFEEFKIVVKNWIEDKNFDQCIIEKNSNDDQWIHIGLYNNKGQQRHELFNLEAA